eukprot:c13930_g1_i1.p1 GENE.c13930_g1_i1~~c13930_g1_i1.p1  ORF type:complete len:510 (+),score=205.28 c13930_g1_i1:40-1530(+)
MLSALRGCHHGARMFETRRFVRSVAKQRPSLLSEIKNVILGPEPAPVVLPPSIPASDLLPSIETKVTTLKNNIRVASQAQHGDVATIGIWVNAGSRYENAENNGTAHFLEHMAFKGTSNRSQGEIESIAENSGAIFNAYTSREHTFYFATVLKNDVPLAVEILSDIVQNPLLKPELIDSERATILEEMAEVDLQHQELVFDKLHELAFRGTSLGRSIIGPTVNVQRLQRADLQAFIKTHYTGDRMVVVGSGAVEHEQLCKLASAALGDVPATSTALISDGGKPFFIGSDVRMREDDMSHAHFAFAFEALPWKSADINALSVMVALLGSWDSAMGKTGANSASKLTRIVAEEGLAEKVMSFNTPYADTGLFGVYASAKYSDLPELSWVIQEEITRLCYEVDEVDVQRAINQVKTSHLGRLDGSQRVAEDIGRQLLTYGRYVTDKEMFQRLDSIKAADVRRVAMSLLNDRDLVLAAVGPIVKLPDYAKLRRRTYWLRY